MRRSLLALTLCSACLGLTAGTEAYLKLGTEVGGRIVPLRWIQQPIRYFVTNRDVSGVTAIELQTAVARAFASWSGVSTAVVSAQFAGFTGSDPFVEDAASVIGFRSRPDLEHVLGSTRFELDAVTGEILASDIFLNAAFQWSVAAGGQASRYDVESIALHEIGHLLGLSHSALGETEVLGPESRRVIAKRAVMFPIAYPAGNIDDRTLEADDVAGVSDIYSSAAFNRSFGSISGRVTLNGVGVFGAHIVAFNPGTGVTTGTFSLTSRGDFVLAGLSPGAYVVRAEPLDDADLDGFFDSTAGVNINFRPAYASKLAVVPAGGSGGTIEIRVPSK
jgi:hypothetical protein